MRLWHQNLIKDLPGPQLLSQHRECCALRGKGWGRKHATVDYVFKYCPIRLFGYHILVMHEMLTRGFVFDHKWLNGLYRGKSCKEWEPLEMVPTKWPTGWVDIKGKYIYPEHNDGYLRECLLNIIEKLRAKMYKISDRYGWQDPKTVAASQELDKFLVLFQKLPYKNS